MCFFCGIDYLGGTDVTSFGVQFENGDVGYCGRVNGEWAVCAKGGGNNRKCRY